MFYGPLRTGMLPAREQSVLDKRHADRRMETEATMFKARLAQERKALRDTFALAALKNGPPGWMNAHEFAVYVYEFADEMMAARDAGGEQEPSSKEETQNPA